MGKFLKYIVLWGLVFGMLAYVLSVGTLWALRKSAFYKPTFVVNAVKKSNFDYIILGASTGLTTLNTKLIDSLTGKQGINLAIDDSGLPNHYLMLQHFLASGKTTKFCVIVPVFDALDVEVNTQSDNDYRFLMFNHTRYVQDYYATLEPKEGLNVLKYSKWLPFLGVSYYSTELFFPSLVSLVNPHRHNRFDDRGNYTYSDNSHSIPVSEIKEKSLAFKNPYIHKIEALCRQHGIQPIFYLAPHSYERVTYYQPERVIINHSQILENNGYFYDAMHVNTHGNIVASKRFSEAFMACINELK